MKTIFVILAAVVIVGCGTETNSQESTATCPNERLAGIWQGAGVKVELKASCEAVDLNTGEVGDYHVSYPTWILIDFGAHKNFGCNGSPSFPAPVEKLTCFDQDGLGVELTR